MQENSKANVYFPFEDIKDAANHYLFSIISMQVNCFACIETKGNLKLFDEQFDRDRIIKFGNRYLKCYYVFGFDPQPMRQIKTMSVSPIDVQNSTNIHLSFGSPPSNFVWALKNRNQNFAINSFSKKRGQLKQVLIEFRSY